MTPLGGGTAVAVAVGEAVETGGVVVATAGGAALGVALATVKAVGKAVGGAGVDVGTAAAEQADRANAASNNVARNRSILVTFRVRGEDCGIGRWAYSSGGTSWDRLPVAVVGPAGVLAPQRWAVRVDRRGVGAVSVHQPHLALAVEQDHSV